MTTRYSTTGAAHKKAIERAGCRTNLGGSGVCVLSGKIEVDGDNKPSSGDLVYLGLLPKGARVIPSLSVFFKETGSQAGPGGEISSAALSSGPEIGVLELDSQGEIVEVGTALPLITNFIQASGIPVTQSVQLRAPLGILKSQSWLRINFNSFYPANAFDEPIFYEVAYVIQD